MNVSAEFPAPNFARMPWKNWNLIIIKKKLIITHFNLPARFFALELKHFDYVGLVRTKVSVRGCVIQCTKIEVVHQ